MGVTDRILVPMVQLLCHNRMITEEVGGVVDRIVEEEVAGEVMVDEEDTEGISTRVIATTAGWREEGGLIGTNEAEVEGITEMEEGEIITTVGTGNGA